MKKIIYLFLFVSLSLFAASNGNEDQLLMQGNSLYQEKKYEAAIEKYLQIEKLKPNSFKINYNLGCAYFRLNDLKNARLYFERAAKLKPENKKIKNNLQVLKANLKDKIEEPKPGFIAKSINKINNNFSLNFISIVLLIVWFCLFLTIAMIISNRFEKKPFYYSLGISILLLVIVFSVYNSKKQYVEKNEAIVFVEEVEIFSEPSTGSAVLFKLHSGTKVSIEESQSGFYHISLPNGMNGWANIRSFNKI